MSKYYYHGIKTSNYATNIMLDILKSGAIKSKRLQKASYKIGFNGPNYISICKKEQEETYKNNTNNAFYKYIYNNYCFVIDENIDAIKCEYISNIDKWNRFDLIKFMINNPERRITDMFDEWQVKDKIEISHIIAIGIPFKTITKTKEIEEIINIAKNLNIDIIDSSEINFIEEYEKKKIIT